LGVSYKPAAELAGGPLKELTVGLDNVLAFTKELDAFETIPRAVIETVLNTFNEPGVSLKEMKKTYFDEIATSQIMNKSEAQKRHCISDLQYTSDLLCKVFAKKRLERLITRMR